jgi:RimJ/RimL family protein N-acetyltransferase
MPFFGSGQAACRRGHIPAFGTCTGSVPATARPARGDLHAPGMQYRGRVDRDVEKRAPIPWPLSDGVVSLRPPRTGEEHVLVAGRDREWERWLGPGEGQPRPTAVILVGGKIVGWVDYDTDRDWLGPQEVNVGYNVFAAYRRRGFATRAMALLFGLLRDHTDHKRANLVIDVDNVASLGVARALGAQVVKSNFDEAGRVSSVRHVVDVSDFDGPAN